MTIELETRRKVFIRGLNWVGDAIIATPALRRLRRAFAGSHITLMVRPWVAAIYENNPDIDELWVQDDATSTWAFFSAVNRIRRAKFDFGIAMPNSFRSAALMALGQIRHRVGFATGARSILLTRKVRIDPGWLEGHQVYYYLNLIDWMTDRKPEPPELVLNPKPESREQVAAMAREAGWDSRPIWMAIAPGSINSMAKRWLPERFAELADRLYNEMKAQVFLLGSGAEREVVDRVASLCKTPVINLSRGLDLAQFIAFMERIHGFIGNDSGAMHVAAALKVPTVAIFGPTKWTTTSPFTPYHKIVRHPVECSPCMLRVCPINHPCMTGIQVDHIVRAIADLAPQIKARISNLSQEGGTA